MGWLLARDYKVEIRTSGVNLTFVGAEKGVEVCVREYLRLSETIETQAANATHDYVEKYKSEHNGQSPRYLKGEDRKSVV